MQVNLPNALDLMNRRTGQVTLHLQEDKTRPLMKIEIAHNGVNSALKFFVLSCQVLVCSLGCTPGVSVLRCVPLQLTAQSSLKAG